MSVQVMVRLYLEKVNDNCRKQNLDFTEFLQRLHKTLQECEDKDLAISWEDILTVLPEEIMAELKARESGAAGKNAAGNAGAMSDAGDITSSGTGTDIVPIRKETTKEEGDNEAAIDTEPEL